MSARAKCTLDVYVSDWREVRDLTEASVKDVRSNLREYLDRAEAGEEIVVTRREPGKFPDLTGFRHSTELLLRISPAIANWDEDQSSQ